MPRLSELTDNYYNDPMGTAPVALPAEIPPELKRVYITGAEEPKEPSVSEPSPLSNNVDKILNSIFRPDEKRLQLWPERLVRAGTTAAGEVASGAVPQWAIDPKTGDVHTSPEMIEKAQEVSALAGSGGLASGGGSLNATPSLRPALRHKEKLYKGKPGQEHQDIIPDSLYNDFQKKAMAGQDLADYNFGFVNDKGHFLSREDALKYGIDNGIIDQQAGKFGTLTSTMFADSSKPGVAIEAVKRPYQNVPDSLMGFKKSGQNKGFDETSYKHEQPVKVTFPDTGDTFVDTIKGLNQKHALERANRNWEGAVIEPLEYTLKPVPYNPFESKS